MMENAKLTDYEAGQVQMLHDVSLILATSYEWSMQQLVELADKVIQHRRQQDLVKARLRNLRPEETDET